MPRTEFGIQKAATLLRNTGLVAIPTETVYGLAADASSDDATGRVFEAKGRPSDNPLIIHTYSARKAWSYVRPDRNALKLAIKYWPGPMTLVLPLLKDAGLSPVATAGRSTCAVRVPSHPVALELLRRLDRPVAAPSANLSGKVSPTTAGHVFDDLAGRIDAILDGGPCEKGIESTIVKTDDSSAVLLRPGALPAAEMEREIGSAIAGSQLPESTAFPGGRPAHYAPTTRLRMNASGFASHEISIGFGQARDACHFNLSAEGNIGQAAIALYSVLRMADRAAMTAGASAIAVAPIPEDGLGFALNDRLRRAAAGSAASSNGSRSAKASTE